MNVSKLIEILNNVNASEAVITANNGKLTVYSETETIKTYSTISADINLPQIKVDVVQLSEALKRAEGADLVLFYADSKLSLKTSNMSVSIAVTEDERIIPTIPGPEDEYFETINFEGLKTAFAKTIGAVGKDKLKPQFQTVNIDSSNVMATNSFVMAVYEMDQVPNTFKDTKLMLDSNFVKQILKVGKKERIARIYLNEASFYIKLGDIIFFCQRGESFRFDYKRILEGALQADHNALMVTGDLKKALKSLKPTLKQVGNRLNFSFEENKTTLRAGDFNLEIAAVYNSEPRQVTLNSEYIETFLKTAGAVTNMAVKNENAPVVLTAADDNNYNFIVMPMRA
jgi:DNA polymerase III sliding clamp (beta) subunit (PCNA family)